MWLITSSVMAVSTSNYAIVTYDGTDLATNTVSIMDTIELVQPAYFCLSSSSDPRITADSVSLSGGGLVSGTVTNTRTIDQTYYIVDESSRPDIRFTFTNVTAEPIEILFEGYYDGNPAHSWTLYLWDFTDSSWDVINSDALPDTSGADFGEVYPIPEPQTNYVSGGVMTSRWYHSASIVAANEVGFDYTAILQAQVNIETAGVFTAVGGYGECVTSKRFTHDLTAGTITNTVAGVYDFSLGGSGTGSTNTAFRGAIFTNDVISPVQFYRTIGGGGDIGNAWGHGSLALPAGTKIDARVTSDKDNSHAAFFDFKFKCEKIDN